MATPDPTFSTKEGRIDFCQDCLDKGYLDLAVRELMKGLNLFPDDPDIYFFLGVAFDSKGMREKAIEYYQHCLDLAPDHGEAHCNLGAALHSLGRLKEAAAQYEIALQHSEKFPEAHYNLGLIYYEAAEELKKSIEMKADQSLAYYYLGIIYSQLDQVDVALDYFTKSVGYNTEH